MRHRTVLFTLTAGLSLTLAACNSTTPAPKVSAQFIEPCEPYQAQSVTKNAARPQNCGDPDPEPIDPEYISMPGTPTLVPWNRDNIAPSSITATKGSRISAQWVPTSATDREDYVRQLFTRVNQNVTAPSTTAVPGSQVVDGRCTLEDVNAISAPEQLLAEQSTASTVFPSVILQGRFLTVQGNSPTPIHVPSSQRAPVRLVDSYLNTATMATSSYTDYAQALRQMLVAANANGDFAQSNIMFDVQSASTIEEASRKFNLDFKAYGANVKTKLDSSSVS